jgi:tRNA(Ile)-lysidine synthase
LPPELSLLDQLRRTNSERQLIRPGAQVLVAVSGGADSLALLCALSSLRDELGISLVAAYLNHEMRGDAGAADAQFVREIAGGWQIPVEAGSRDVPALARRTGLSLEEAGREARYRFFGRAARRAGCDTIATAHTADDRAENVILHLLRGTGLDGLAGFPARRPLRFNRPTPVVIRPLIDVTRAVVLAYCAENHLQPRHDVTNDSPEFLRNRVRHELLPLLEARYSPALRRHLVRLARLAEEETELLDDQAWELVRRAILGMEIGASSEYASGQEQEGDHGVGYSRVHRRQDGSSAAILVQDARASSESEAVALRLSRPVLSSAPPALARRALRLALGAIVPGPPAELATVERLLSLARGERPGFMLPGHRLMARITDRELVLEPHDPIRCFVEAEPIPLAIPGVTTLGWSDGTIVARIIPSRTEGSADCRSPYSLLPTPAGEALIDCDRLDGSLTVRPPRSGDRIQPLGMTGRRKLQDIFTDQKLSRAARRRVPVVIAGDTIVWVAGCCVSEAAKVTPRTRQAVGLVWERGGGGAPPSGA